MLRRLAVILLSLTLSGGILVISLFRNASIRYAFTAPAGPTTENVSTNVNYLLAFPGLVLPDNVLWPVKVVRDKLWLVFAADPAKKAEIDLLLADKRIGSAIDLFQRNKPNLGYSTLTKSEIYLQNAQAEAKKAQSNGEDVGALMQKIALASLKHVQVSQQILALAPDDAKPQVILTMQQPQTVFKTIQSDLTALGLTSPKNPFTWN